MSEPMPDGVRWSWLHRCLRRAPGTMPSWVLSSSGCDPNDAASWIAFPLVLLLVTGAILFAAEFGYGGKLVSGYTMAGGVAAVIVIGVLVERTVIGPCRKAERKARAIARRSKTADIQVNSPAPTPDAPVGSS